MKTEAKQHQHAARTAPHLHRPRADHVAGVGKKARADRLATPPSPAEIAAETLRRARQLGAQVTVNARTTDPAAFLRKEIGGAHGAPP